MPKKRVKTARPHQVQRRKLHLALHRGGNSLSPARGECRHQTQLNGIPYPDNALGTVSENNSPASQTAILIANRRLAPPSSTAISRWTS